MTEEPIPSVRLYKRDDFNVPATRLIVEVYPSPDQSYFGSWYMEIPHENDEDEVDLDELYALRDAVSAASQQIELLLKMIEEQDYDQ